MGYHISSNKLMVRELNDKLRIHGDPSIGKIVLTREVHALSSEDVIKLINSIRAYDKWDPEKDDPWSEHDFGKVSINGTDVFWKIDYYDPSYQRGVEDHMKNNTSMCKRVLTVMYAHEY